jgi:hypothetical protein
MTSDAGEALQKTAIKQRTQQATIHTGMFMQTLAAREVGFSACLFSDLIF